LEKKLKIRNKEIGKQTSSFGVLKTKKWKNRGKTKKYLGKT
jgi:hypothetical protein